MKKLLFNRVAVSILLTSVTLILLVVLLSYSNRNNAGDTISSNLQSKEEIERIVKGVDDYKSVVLAYNTSDYNKTIELAIELGKNEHVHYTDKLNSYTLCIQASVKINDGRKTMCYESAKKLAQLLTNGQEKIVWLKNLENINDGVMVDGSVDDTDELR